MNQAERRLFLISYLLKEQAQYSDVIIPNSEYEQRRLLRALLNVRDPQNVSDEFIKVQDEYLREETRKKGITSVSDLKSVRDGIYLWRGDITTLECDGIVNAANCRMLGCFCPNHYCIDNAIHTFSGVQLRLDCDGIMKKQGHEEQTGKAKITPAYNLPCRYVLHTVGPIIRGRVSGKDRELLASCYRSCLELADEYKLKNIAFCCISTGEFHFPNKEAAKIAIATVKEYKERTHSEIEVIFNVFKELDYDIYRELLATD